MSILFLEMALFSWEKYVFFQNMNTFKYRVDIRGFGNLAYYKKIFEDTVKAVQKCYDRNIYEINVKRIRTCNSIPSSNRSKINFISRALEDLTNEGTLTFIGRNSPKKYKINTRPDYKTLAKSLGL